MATPEAVKALVSSLGISYKQTRESYIFTCPRCNKDKKLYIRKTDGRFVCWYCVVKDGYQGRPEFAFADLSGEPLSSIKQKLYGEGEGQFEAKLVVQINEYMDDEEIYDSEIDTNPMPEVSWPSEYLPIDHKNSERGASYLTGRGIPVEIAMEYRIRYSPHRRAVVFPVEHQGKLYGWQERLVIPTTYDTPEGEVTIPKSRTSYGLRKGEVLMFSDRVTGDHAVLCEGPIDAIKAHLCGGNVAAMGKGVTPMQTGYLLNNGCKRLYLALDPDAAEETQALYKDLYGSVELYSMMPEKADDLGEMGFEEVLELYRSATKLGAGRLFVFLRSQV